MHCISLMLSSCVCVCVCLCVYAAFMETLQLTVTQPFINILLIYFISSVIAYCISPHASFYACLSCLKRCSLGRFQGEFITSNILHLNYFNNNLIVN